MLRVTKYFYHLKISHCLTVNHSASIDNNKQFKSQKSPKRKTLKEIRNFNKIIFISLKRSNIKFRFKSTYISTQFIYFS